MKKAFTLLEVVLVCALLSLLALCLFKAHKHCDSLFLSLSAQHLSDTIGYLQLQAHQTGVPQTLFLEISHNTYCYASDKPQAIIRQHLGYGCRFGTPKGAHGPPAKPTTLLTGATTFPQSTTPDHYEIAIDVQGTCSPGAIYLTNHGRTEGYALTSTRASVQPIKAYRYQTGKWIKHTW